MAIIEVKDLVKKFDDFTAVDSISFSVEQGEIFAFLGPNGAGKTTTIKMLTTLLQPSSGSIFLNDFEFQRML
jgi:ABC-2 type transport system ATP-binding protein